MEIKKVIKWDGKLKSLHFEGNDLVDENGEVLNLNEYMKAAYGDKTFDVSSTAKEEEILEVEINTDEDEDDEE